MILPLKAIEGLRIRPDDGWEERGFPEALSVPHFYEAEPGDRLRLLDRRCKLGVATYRPEIEDKWIHTYDYSPNQAWVVYNNDLCADGYRGDDYVFTERTYFRICILKPGGVFDGEDINKIVAFERADTLRFALLADTHYVVNGTWDATAGAIWAASRRRGLDGVVHLGDITDGMLGKEILKDYVNIVLGDLRQTGLPVWTALGNHDGNYFKNNPETLTESEQRDLYFNGGALRYFVDFESHKLRMLFLDSFDHRESLRYGYSAECTDWLSRTLRETPEDYSLLLFSHLPPTARLQYWAKSIRGEKDISVLTKQYKSRILAWINGHNHADRLDNDEGYPVISIANAKCEAFTEYKPEGWITPERTPGSASEQLWDILTVDTQAGTLRFERQGAGGDRLVKGGMAQWL